VGIFSAFQRRAICLQLTPCLCSSSADESLFKLATRIQARAIRRCGELLKEIEPASQAQLKQNRMDGGGPPVETRKEAAEKAGLSERQQKTAVRVANVPKEEFEAQVESDSPPTVTALAEQGTRKLPLQACYTCPPSRCLL
jgi:hypothetical protein